MNLIFSCLEVNEFLSKYSQSPMIPIINTNEIKFLLKHRKIFVSELVTEPDQIPYFFLNLINHIKKNDICFAINYTIYKRDLAILTKKYKGEILVEANDEDRIYFEVNDTLVDNDVKLDWFDIWGHACEGWIMNSKAYGLFKDFLNGVYSEKDMNDFLDNLKYTFEFGGIHESIRFISFNDELKNILGKYDLNQNFKRL